MRKKLTLSLLSLVLGVVLFALPAKAQSDVVLVVKLEGMIDNSMWQYIDKSITEAESVGAKAIIIEMDTPGGMVDPATKIKKRILSSEIPVTTYITNYGLSAGALVALASEHIAMAPGSSIGAAEPRLGLTGEKVDEKYLSAFRSEMESAAEAKGRNPEIAAAMVDSDIAIEGLIEKGKLLTLTPQKAKEFGIADFIANNRQEVLKALKLSGVEVREMEPSTAQWFAQVVTSPWVAPLLLLIGITGIILEIFTFSYGIAGILGLVSIGIFFGGHMLAGHAGWEAVMVFALGLVSIAVEIFIIPGFGIAGVIGSALLVASIFMAAATVSQAVISLLITFIGAVIITIFGTRHLTKRGLWRPLVLGESLESAKGYHSSNQRLKELVGHEGVAITPLRPSGTALINDSRVDVVAEGAFIPAGAKVKVLYVEGMRVVVEEIKVTD